MTNPTHIVLFDSDCGLCNQVRQIVEALDWLEFMRWVPNHSPEARKYGIPQADLDRAVYIIGSSGTRSGFEAVQSMVGRLPLAWFVMAYIVSKKPWTALLFAFLLSPLAKPAGDPLYEWVATNRYRLPGSTCDNQIK